ncbi:uncharacterized protein ACRADG_009848 isoform 1-T1 [Cochliomyia hominivorax]
MATLKGIRFIIFLSVLGGATGLTLYPIAVKPLINVEDYKRQRKLHNWDNSKRRNTTKALNWDNSKKR